MTALDSMTMAISMSSNAGSQKQLAPVADSSAFCSVSFVRPKLILNGNVSVGIGTIIESDVSTKIRYWRGFCPHKIT
jgi:hypothetical protein